MRRCSLKPGRSQKFGKKPSLVLKPSAKLKTCLKKKPSLTLKASAVAKKDKKQTKKQEADKQAKKLGQQASKDPLPPLPPPAEGPEEEEPQVDELLHKEVAVTSEAAGRLSYEKRGKLTHLGSNGFYTLLAATGTYPVKKEWLQLLSEKPIPELEWPKWTRMSKKDLLLMLSCLSANPLDMLGLEPTLWDTQAIIKCPEEVPELEDQHIWLGWLLLRWMLTKSHEKFPEDMGITCVDPLLIFSILEQKANVQLLQALRDSFTDKTQILLIPILRSFHWTLLVAQRDGTQKLQWRRYDTLSVEHAGSHAAQEFIGKVLDPDFVLPPLTNVATQPVGSNACGAYLLHYLELELRVFRGELPSVWPALGWKQWKLRLKTAAEKLSAEQKLKAKECLDKENSEKKQRDEVESLRKKAEDKLAKLTNITSMAYITAQEALNKNSQRFTWKDLSQEATLKILSLQFSLGVCSKCRWTSGCLECSSYKALRYHLHSEAAKAKKLAYLSRGPGFQSIYSMFSSGFLRLSTSVLSFLSSFWYLHLFLASLLAWEAIAVTMILLLSQEKSGDTLLSKHVMLSIQAGQSSATQSLEHPKPQQLLGTQAFTQLPQQQSFFWHHGLPAEDGVHLLGFQGLLWHSLLQ